MEKTGAFWQKKDKNGKSFLSGVITIGEVDHPILIFKNSFKKESKHPDYIAYDSTSDSTEDKKVF